LVIQFMPFGSVEDLVVRRQGKSLPLAVLLQIAVDASAAVLHLHMEGVVHRDIAARNFLVDKVDGQYRASICDFGLSRLISNANPDEEGHALKGEQLPVKWLAPECLARGVYSRASDVFAFGVFLWEMFTRAEPYEGVNMKDLGVKIVKEHLRPALGPEVPSSIAVLLKKCWNGEANARPTMKDLNQRLQFALEAAVEEAGDAAPVIVLALEEEKDVVKLKADEELASRYPTSYEPFAVADAAKAAYGHYTPAADQYVHVDIGSAS